VESPIYYIKKPCAADAVDVVKPWWEPKTRVKVCKDAHRARPVLQSEGQDIL